MIKKLAIAFSLTMCLLCGCRTEHEREFTDDFIEVSSDPCSNGILDGTEELVDCGGTCEPCNALTVPCEVETDAFFLDGSTLEVLSTQSFSSEIYIYFTNGLAITLQFGGGGYNPGTVYSCIAGTSPSASQVRVYGDMGSEFWYYSGTNNKLYLEGSDANLSVTFCELNLTSNMTSTEYLFNGNISGI